MRNTGVLPGNGMQLGMALVEFATLNMRLWLRNRRCDTPVVGDGAADVSLTSHGHRIGTVWRTIETIGAGTVKPRRLILWLDDPAAMAALPASLVRLRTRGLEIRLCRGYGPHTKYYPYVREITCDGEDFTLVTADDDVYYPPTWLEELLRAHRPGQVTTFRARIRSAEPYVSWPTCTTTETSPRVFATGVSGAAYPPELQRTLRDRGDAFMAVCPRADDFWLHYAAVATGIPVHQVRDTAALWWSMPVASKRGLWDGKGTANDAIAAATERAWL
ncbi:uncharacterized protein RMCC_3125 [Mycolicibacterium canariasense]|uniref:Glycosyltransferase n=1 Tax=Mycolicibacterium canariasense TaxID=228230 RepID=A0A100WDV9_MYCCR|nr:hypothetical protein [Mycolicibacterium canariasense]MCV7207774.1 hypothetical protein [Mycolicibacterium canariasense]GAS96159.1 uncharacterized protein RMCC_3125 [Mycolicibacterium canariasense]